jgi:hypothetical protein
MSAVKVSEIHARLKAKETSDVLEAMKLLLIGWPDYQFNDEDLVIHHFFIFEQLLTFCSLRGISISYEQTLVEILDHI